MNDRHDSRFSSNDAPTSVESSLAAIIDRYGAGLLHEPERLRLLLIQKFPADDPQVVHLLAALAAEVPQRLLDANDDDGVNILLPQLTDRLGADPAFDRHAARWTVRAWANALALPTSGLDRVTAVPMPIPTPNVVDFASIVTPLSNRGRTAPAAPTPIAPQPVGPSAADPAVARVAAGGGVPPEPRTPGPAPATPAAASVPSFVKAAAPVEPPAATPTVPTPPAARPPRDERPIAAEPSKPVRMAPPAPPPTAPQPAVRTPAADTAGARVAAQSDVFRKGPAAGPMPSPTAIAPTPAIGNAAPVVPPALARDAPASPAAAPSPPRQPVDAEPSIGFPTWARVSSPAPAKPTVAARSADRPRRKSLIVAALIAFALLAIGVILYVAFRPDRVAVGDEGMRPPATARAGPSTAESTAAGAAVPTNDRAAPVATPAPPITAPSPAAAAPVAPVPAAATPAAPRGPSITRIEVPRIVAGEPFAIGVTASTGAAELAAIERRAVDATGRVDPGAIVTPVGGLERSRSGGLLMPFQAIDTPSQATVEVTVVDRAGGRSAPRRIELRATAASAGTLAAGVPPAAKQAPVPKADTREKTPPVAKAASPAAPARTPAACTRATCGSIASVRPADAGSSAFDVIVRLDDRSIQVIRQSTRWRVGSRVRLVNGSLQQLS